METMHFNIAQAGLILKTILSHLGRPNKRFDTHEKLSCGGKVS